MNFNESRNKDLYEKMSKKLDKDAFDEKYKAILEYFDDMRANKVLQDDKISKLENKSSQPNKMNKLILYYNIGSIVINIVILIKLFL